MQDQYLDMFEGRLCILLKQLLVYIHIHFLFNCFQTQQRKVSDKKDEVRKRIVVTNGTGVATSLHELRLSQKTSQRNHQTETQNQPSSPSSSTSSRIR